MKIAIITSNELRHKFFRKLLNTFCDIEIVCCLCEDDKNNQKLSVLSSDTCSDLEKQHFLDRDIIEKDFFECFVNNSVEPENNHIIMKNQINLDSELQKILHKSNPDIIVSYGCSIIREPLLSYYQGKFINIHLGLSPYYKGAGTNFWPLVNNEPEYIGVTYMMIDEKIDAGAIIHQIRPEIFMMDNVHTIGNRLIKSMTEELVNVLLNFYKLNNINKKSIASEKIYIKNDFNKKSIKILNKNIQNNMIKNYLTNKSARDNKVPLIKLEDCF